MDELESKIFLYLFASVVNCCALTQPQRHRGTEDDGHWRGQGEKRIERLCGSAAVNLSRGSMRQYTVVYGNKTTEAQSAQRTTDIGGGRERRGLSSSANSAALRLILELGKNEAVTGGVRE